MTAASSAWMNITERSSLMRFIDINLRGAAQVIFQNNPLTGIFFLLAIGWNSVAEGQVAIIIGAIIALITATTTAIILNVDRTSLRQGMMGFNGVLVGVAIPTFLANTFLMWPILIIAAATSTIVMLAVSNVMKTWQVPALTFPFVLTTWFFLLSAYAFNHLPISSMGPPALPLQGTDITNAATPSVIELFEIWFKGPAQVFLINNTISGILIVIGLLISSRAAAFFALAGSATGLLMALSLGANSEDINAGLYGFSAVLTAVALGSVFYAPLWRTAIYALLGTIFTVIVQAAMNIGMAPIGIPALTGPFVFATWLFLLPKQDLQPHPHALLKDSTVTDKE